MYTAADFRQAFADYARFNQELFDNLSPTAGILSVFGFKSAKPGSDPGHEKFINEMKSALSEVCADNPSPAEAEAIINVIFGARNTYTEQNINPFMFAAIEGLTVDLIPYLSPEKAAQLYEQYRKEVPRSQRTPVQKQVLTVLKRTAGAGN